MNFLKSLSTPFRGGLLMFAGLAVAVALLYDWSPATAQTPPTKLAVVDVNKVLSSSKPGRAAYDSLKKLQESKLAEMTAMDNSIKQLEATRTAANASTVDKQVSDKRVAMRRAAEDAEKAIQVERDKALQGLELKVKPVVDAVSKELKLALVFNKFESGLVYADDSTDITSVVIQKLDAATP